MSVFGEGEEGERDLDFLCLVLFSLHLDAFVEHLLYTKHILYLELATNWGWGLEENTTEAENAKPTIMHYIIHLCLSFRHPLLQEASLELPILGHLALLCSPLFPPNREFIAAIFYGSPSHEKVMATHSNILTWEILWMEEPGRLQFVGLQIVGHKWATRLGILIVSLAF